MNSYATPRSQKQDTEQAVSPQDSLCRVHATVKAPCIHIKFELIAHYFFVGRDGSIDLYTGCEPQGCVALSPTLSPRPYLRSEGDGLVQAAGGDGGDLQALVPELG